MNQSFEESILKMLDRPIAFQRVFVDLTGSVQAALMLSQAFYWSKRTSNKERWFYKSSNDWKEETGLSRHEQDTARKHLKKTSFWKEKLSGVPATVHFKIDILELFSSLTEISKQEIQFAENSQSSLPDSSKHSITETTTETTFTESKDSVSKKPLTSDTIDLSIESEKKTTIAETKKSCYPEFVKFWCEAYPELGFDATSGAKIKSLINRTVEIVKLNSGDLTEQKINGVFQYILNYVKASNHWVHGKSITVLDAKYREIYREIKQGKPLQRANPSSSQVFGKYSNI